MSFFWQAQQDADTPSRFTYTAPPIACVGASDNQFFMGGVGMATHIDALQRFFDKPLLWATIQFLNHGMLGDDMVLDVGNGRRRAQCGASHGDHAARRCGAASQFGRIGPTWR